MPSNDLGNVVGLIRSETSPDFKKYLIWGKILNPVTPDIVELNFYDGVSESWIPLASSGFNYWLKSVISDELTSPPVTVDEGDRYLIAESATGDWSGLSGQIAEYRNSAWVYVVPKEGYILRAQNRDSTILEFRGEWASSGYWDVQDFTTDINLSEYVRVDQGDKPNGFAALNPEGKLTISVIAADQLGFNPIVPANWESSSTTIWAALEELKRISATFAPTVPDTRPTDFQIGNITAGTLTSELRGLSLGALWQSALYGETHPDYQEPYSTLTPNGTIRVELGEIFQVNVTNVFTPGDAGELTSISILRQQPSDSGFVVVYESPDDPKPFSINYQEADVQLTTLGHAQSYQGGSVYGQGPVLENANDELDPVGRIEAGSKFSDPYLTYQVFQKIFFGKNSSDPNTSSLVRALTHTWDDTTIVSIEMQNGDTSVVVVIPNGKTLTLVETISSVGTANITPTLLSTEESINVEGPELGFAQPHKKYFLQPESPFTLSTLKFYIS